MEYIKLRLDLFATKGTARKTKNGRDSNPKYRGVKKSDGQIVRRGHIIVKTDNRFKPGKGTDVGKDYTIFCNIDYGKVSYTRRNKRPLVRVFPITEEEFKRLDK